MQHCCKEGKHCWAAGAPMVLLESALPLECSTTEQMSSPVKQVGIWHVTRYRLHLLLLSYEAKLFSRKFWYAIHISRNLVKHKLMLCIFSSPSSHPVRRNQSPFLPWTPYIWMLKCIWLIYCTSNLYFSIQSLLDSPLEASYSTTIYFGNVITNLFW